MRVAVTGAGGFAGRVIAARLRQEGVVLDVLRHGGVAESGASTLPPHDATDAAFEACLRGATHVVHCAGLTNARKGTPESAYFNANARLTGRLARAARRTGARNFIFLSSIRAVAGSGFEGTIKASTLPDPSDAYGRSKLAAETEARDAFAGNFGNLAVLRLAPVYGPGMRGNLARLMRLCDSPLPLPLGGLNAERSLLGVDALAELVLAIVRNGTPRDTYLVGDSRPARIEDIAAAFRRGLDRPQRLLPAPSRLLGALARRGGSFSSLQAFAMSQVCDSSALAEDRLPQRADSLDGLAACARSWVSAGRSRC